MLKFCEALDFWKTFFSGDRLKIFCEDLFFGDRLKNFCEDLFFFFFWRALALCVLGPWPWPRAFLSLASRVSVLGKAVLGLGLGFFCVLGLGLEPCVLDSTSALYYVGEVEALCVQEPVADLIIGNITGVREADNPDMQ